jgi:S-adenosylmethionine synthetase
MALLQIRYEYECNEIGGFGHRGSVEGREWVSHRAVMGGLICCGPRKADRLSHRTHLFTSESVSMGHPDKVSDRISDAVLDAMLSANPEARVACEVLVTGGTIVVAGEISGAPFDDELIRRIALETVEACGYDETNPGFNPGEVTVHNLVVPQSADIAMGVDADSDGELGAGDQGMMFGFATNDTDTLMPLPIQMAHRLIARQAEVRMAGGIRGLRPDAKSQVTVEYEGKTPVRVQSLVLSTQHAPEWSDNQRDLQAEVVEHILRPVLGEWWHEEITAHINPTGKFEIGGPVGDTGLTGRKIIVDTYGGWGRHGGGAFSGKDPSKVDRSGAYMARYVAKNIVAAGLAGECEVRLSYAIGVPEPTSVTVDCHGSQQVDEAAIESAVREIFPLTPRGIMDTLRLRAPIYQPTSFHGHFGREADEAGAGTFSWERVDRVEALKTALSV